MRLAWALGLTLGIPLYFGYPQPMGLAQSNIQIDATIGNQSSRILPTLDPLVEIIEGGIQQGQNLFHSFEQFNVGENRSVVFVSQDPLITNILARVTGTQRSAINGRLGTFRRFDGQRAPGDLNLFLLNPNGISFGPNASLTVGTATRGSFIASSLDGLVWPDGNRFSGITPESGDALLRITGDPSGFIASQRALPAITFQNSFLGVPSGQSLILLGGDITANDSTLFTFFPDGGRIELGSIASAGNVALNGEGNSWSLGFRPEQSRGNLALSNSTLDTTGTASGGNITLYGKDIRLNNSQLFTGIFQGQGNSQSPVGHLTLDGTGQLLISGNSTLQNFIGLDATGTGGNIAVSGDSIEIRDGSSLEAITLGRGNAGTISLRSNSGITLVGENTPSIFTGNAPIIANIVRTDQQGNSGDIEIAAQFLTLEDGAQINISTGGKGTSGSLRINTQDSVRLVRSSLFSEVSDRGGEGDGGNITITTGDFFHLEGSSIRADTERLGNAGDVTILARNDVLFSGAAATNVSSGTIRPSSILSSVEPGAIGNGGNIRIEAQNIRLIDHGEISVRTASQGNAGRITLAARDTIRLSGEDVVVSSGVRDRGRGNGGQLSLSGQHIFLEASAQLLTSTAGVGNAGKVAIAATESLELRSGSDIFTEVTCACETGGTGGIGNGGDIDITTGRFLMDGGTNLRADTEARGNAGNINITARANAIFRGTSTDTSSGAYSQVEPDAEGDGGDIRITTPFLFLSGDHQLTTQTQGQGNAGNIRIDASQVQIQGPRTQIISSASNQNRLPGTSGNGGNIRVTGAEQFQLMDGAQILASTDINGRAGNILLEADQLTLTNGSHILSESNAGKDGGNLDLIGNQALLLRQESLISTTAGNNQTPGNGGNIRLDSDFVIGFPAENSDIIANAFEGSGGNITINARAIFNFDRASGQTLEQLRQDRRNNISASSQLGSSGVLNLTGFNVDPSRGSTDLPSDLVDRTAQIDRSCTAQSYRNNRLSLTGRSGIPPSPREPLRTMLPFSGWIPRQPRSMATAAGPSSSPSPLPQRSALGEASTWRIQHDGRVSLMPSHASLPFRRSDCQTHFSAP